jgi:hypothetical protein
LVKASVYILVWESLWLGWAYLTQKNAARRDHAHRHRLQNQNLH